MNKLFVYCKLKIKLSFHLFMIMLFHFAHTFSSIYRSLRKIYHSGYSF